LLSKGCFFYLDSDLVDLGITRGTVKLTYETADGQFRGWAEYTSPVKMTGEDAVGVARALLERGAARPARM